MTILCISIFFKNYVFVPMDSLYNNTLFCHWWSNSIFIIFSPVIWLKWYYTSNINAIYLVYYVSWTRYIARIFFWGGGGLTNRFFNGKPCRIILQLIDLFFACGSFVNNFKKFWGRSRSHGPTSWQRACPKQLKKCEIQGIAMTVAIFNFK